MASIFNQTMTATGLTMTGKVNAQTSTLSPVNDLDSHVNLDSPVNGLDSHVDHDKPFNDLDSPVTKKQKQRQKQDHPQDNDNNVTLTTATSRVINLPELLTLILRDLSARDLCRLFSVSKYFLATITSSIHLRRRLWWEPCPKLSAYLSNSPRFLNPHLLAAKSSGRLPIKTFLTWPLKDGGLIVDIHFSSGRNLRRMYEYRGLGVGAEATWRFMVVRQPYDERTVWSLGVCEDGCTGEGHGSVGVKCGGLREVRFRVEGFVPTLGMLVDELVERVWVDVGGWVGKEGEGNGME